MKLKKLNARGFSHEVLAIAFVAVFAIAGVAYLVASHAAVPKAKTVSVRPAKIIVSAYRVKSSSGDVMGPNLLGTSKADLFARNIQTSAGPLVLPSCNQLTAGGGGWLPDLRTMRTLYCTPGYYTFHLDNNANLSGVVGTKHTQTTAFATVSLNVASGKTYKINLGTLHNY